ncbi:MAG: methyltransferase domain-containing protein [Pirellulales bacterium]|nr:methyltransferase domain-containing protein [Pirellulales bacterium]
MWRVVVPLRRALIRQKAGKSRLHAEPYQVYWISPRIIKNAIYRQIDGVLNTEIVAGLTKSGNWDKQTTLVQDLAIIRGAKERFTDGKDWEDTDYYRIHLEEITKGQKWRGCESKSDLEEYFHRFDQLYERIKSDGYKPQCELEDPEFAGTSPAENEIAVHIDRDGRYIFCNGAHRLGIALALGIEKIPVKVCIRHASWQAFCGEILDHARDNGGKVYQPITHPDLRGVPSAHDESRFDIIYGHLPEDKGTLLDIGSNWGYFCHRFEELGFDCYAVESDLENRHFLEKLKTAGERKFKVVPQSILDYRDKLNFDVVLALNIFHHFLKREEDHRALVDFLKRMDMSMMIFEPHDPSEPQMVGAYRNYEPDEFVQFVMKHSGLNHSKKIGECEDGRLIYKLWKSELHVEP